MTDLDAEDGRNFEGLDPREAQEALAEELAGGDDGEEGNALEDDEKLSGAEPKEGMHDPVATAAQQAEFARMAEALLFAASEPLDETSIADRLPDGADVPAILEALRLQYENRGVTLSKINKKWRFVTATDVAHVLEKEKVQQRRLSRAALETLAIIAYHQPCTRADIEDVRGVMVSKGSLDQLLEIGWVGLRGRRRHAPGRPILYGTTQAFLEHFGLESVQDLPGLADLKAAGLLDARLPPGFSVPTPADSDEIEDEIEDEDADDGDVEFAQDFLDDDADGTQNP
ncbi:MAG: SMC-Scp complex subunit ScpB [Parvularculaceae bacterium]